MVHYWRCRDCLAVFTTADRDPGLICSCGGSLDYLGVPRRSRLSRTVDVIPCDSRCLDANGPNCACSCFGANHGSHRLVTVTRDGGAVPRVSSGGDLDAAAAFRTAKTDALARINALPGRRDYLAGRWIPRSQFDTNRAALADYRAALKLTSNRGRLARLAAVAGGGAS